MFICCQIVTFLCFFFSSRRRHTRCGRDWSSDVCSSDLRPQRQRWLSATRVLAASLLPPPRPPPRGNRLVSEICRSEEHTSELQSRPHLVCRLLLEKKKKILLYQYYMLTQLYHLFILLL